MVRIVQRIVPRTIHRIRVINKTKMIGIPIMVSLFTYTKFICIMISVFYYVHRLVSKERQYEKI